MNEEMAFLALIAFVVVFVFGGIGFLTYGDMVGKHELNIACVKAGKTLIGDSCVRVMP